MCEMRVDGSCFEISTLINDVTWFQHEVHADTPHVRRRGILSDEPTRSKESHGAGSEPL